MEKMNELFESANKIYSKLADEVSRDIFRNRILLSTTGDWQYARYLAKHYLKGYDSDLIFTGIADNIMKLQLDSKQEYIIYGAGEMGSQAFHELKREKLNAMAFCDANVAKQGTFFHGVPIISPTQLERYSKSWILLAVWNQSDVIRKKLLQLGVDSERIIDGFLCENYVDMDQYFDEEIIRFGNNEVFLDCGCYDFGTSDVFRRKCPNYQKIVCFEPNETNRKKIEEHIQKQAIERVDIIPYGVWNSETTLYFNGEGSSARVDSTGDEKIQTVVIDNLNIGEISFIKMDIEGSELKALEGAFETIRKNKPKLAISVYHNPEDIITLPAFILNIVPEYKLYLRHYSNYFATETVLYAI